MSAIERELMMNRNAVMYPDPVSPPEPTYGMEQVEQVVLAQAPQESGLDTQSDLEKVSFPQFARGAFDTAAAGMKGAVQGWVGLPGDLESIGRLIFDLVGADVDQETYLKTTDEIKRMLDQYAPLNTKQDTSTAETLGEFVAPGGYIKGVKSAVKAVKKVTTKKPAAKMPQPQEAQ